MAERLIGTGTTNANGVASVTYRGNGRGKMDIIAKSGRIQSETYEVLDCILYDDMETENINKYKVSNNANISYSSEWSISGSKSIKWIYDNTALSNTKYFGLYFKDNPSAYYFDLSKLKGQQIRLELDVNCEIDFDGSKNAGMYLAIYYKETSTSIWQTLGSTITFNSNTQHYEGIYNVPSNCTELWVRANANQNCPSGTLYADNWKIYQV